MTRTEDTPQGAQILLGDVAPITTPGTSRHFRQEAAMTLYLCATDLESGLTFYATTTRRGSRKITYHVLPERMRTLDNPIAAQFVPLYFRRAAKAAVLA